MFKACQMLGKASKTLWRCGTQDVRLVLYADVLPGLRRLMGNPMSFIDRHLGPPFRRRRADARNPGILFPGCADGLLSPRRFALTANCGYLLRCRNMRNQAKIASYACEE